MRPFSLLVKPASADCNLRCRYCFYLDKCGLYPETARHRMGPDVLDRMIGTYMATPQPMYAFGWQGGEPTLMGLEFFKEVTRLQQLHGRTGTSVSNGLQTNTTLITDAWAEHLRRYNFLVGASIDGPPQVHDTYRRFVNGRGAHAEVMKGLDVLKRNRVEYNVLTLVSQANVHRPREIYHYLRDTLGVTFHQYIECVEFDADGRLRPFAVNGREWGDFLCAVYDEWIRCEDTRRVSIRLFDSILALLVDETANVCSMGRDCRQYLVVEHNGDVYPCDFYVRADLRLGNIMEDAWETLLASPRYEAFGARKRRWNDACAACRHLRFCAGCCPKNRPGPDGECGRISALCEGWLRFYDHTLGGFEKLADEVRRDREAARLEANRQRIAVLPDNRVARNDPCPCGSGRKYKKCCGR